MTLHIPLLVPHGMATHFLLLQSSDGKQSGFFLQDLLLHHPLSHFCDPMHSLSFLYSQYTTQIQLIHYSNFIINLCTLPALDRNTKTSLRLIFTNFIAWTTFWVTLSSPVSAKRIYTPIASAL